MKIEQVIFGNLIENEDYARKVIPFLKEEYFHDTIDRTIFKLISNYTDQYSTFPTREALLIDLNNVTGLNDDQFKTCKSTIESIHSSSDKEIDWLVDNTEKFCKDKALYNALMDSIKIVDDKRDNISVGAIPQILSDALAVSFDTNIGHDFLDNAESRYEFYHRTEVRVPFDLDYMNKITNGGLPRKTLNIVLASTGAGKSLFMCHCAANNLLNGLNVLYVTLEMAEERIAERIDANLMNLPLDELRQIPKESYTKKIDKLKNKTQGKLIVKEYPTSCAGANNFRYLLNELSIKRGFKPDIIYIDYLNICASSRLKQGNNVNSYSYIKAIAEELRGLAVEFNVPIVSATQTTRGGYDNSDIGLTDTSESFGLPATADFMIALISTDELKALNQLMIKQLKNRYADPEMYKRFVVGIDRSRMKLYDCENSAQDDIIDEPVYDNTPSGQFDRNKFSGFK